MKKHVLVSAALVIGLLASTSVMARNGPSRPIQATPAKVCGTQTGPANEPGLQLPDKTVVLLTMEAPNGVTDPEKKAARQKVISELPGTGQYVCVSGLYFQDQGGVVRLTADQKSK
jgi:hypothetical protein